MEVNITGNSAEGYTNNPREQRKPLSLGPSSQGELQRNTQRMNPFKPNNGNPGGANNMRGYQDTLNQGGKPMPGGYQQPPRPPMPERTYNHGRSPFLHGSSWMNQDRPPMPGGSQEWMSDYLGMQDQEAIRRDPRAAQEQARRAFDQFGSDPNWLNSQRPTEFQQGGDNWTNNMNNFMANLFRGENNPGQRNDTIMPVPNFGREGQSRGREDLYRRLQELLQGRGANRPQDMGQSQGYWDQGQRSDLGRYVPPMMRNPTLDPTDWYNSGGYNYNLPGAAGNFPTQPREQSYIPPRNRGRG